MLKFTETEKSYTEIPNECSLCINVFNFDYKHFNSDSKSYLEDVGEVLTYTKLDALIEENEGCTTIVICGGENDSLEVNDFAKYIKRKHGLRVCWCLRKELKTLGMDLENFDYIKKKFPWTETKLFGVPQSHEVDENYNPIYGLVEITK